MNIINWLKYWGQLLLLPVYWISFFVPRDRKIWLFGSTFGRRFADNPKYLYLYVSQHKKELGVRPVWISHDKSIVSMLSKKGYEAYYYHSLKGIWLALRGKIYIFDNYSKDINFWQSGGAVKLNLWHGVGNKRINYDNMHDKVRHPASLWERWKYFPRRLSDEKPSHYILATSPMMCRIFAKAFHVPKRHVLEAGYPRNDYIIGSDIKNIYMPSERKALGMLKRWKAVGAGIVLYMPTFRDSETMFAGIMDLNVFNAFLEKNNLLFLVKLHPKSKLKDTFAKFSYSNILCLDADADPYVFLGKADILVTDYSSVYSDFMLLDRPVVSFQYDYKEYSGQTREGYFDFSIYMPETRAYDMEGLMAGIEGALHGDTAKEARAVSRGRMFSSLAADGCEKICKKMFKAGGSGTYIKERKMELPAYGNYKLISIDIFDTLLLRTVAKATDLFIKTWDKAVEKGIAKSAISSKEYMKLRIEMERRARLCAPGREVSLEGIYAKFPDFIAHNLEALKALEVECENECCYANPAILEWLEDAKQHGCILVLVSDMYLSSSSIKGILEHNGICTSIFDNVIVSNEYGCSKQDGALFKVLLEKYPQFSAGEILHIGDNKNADYQQPLKTGIHAFHYDVIPERLYSIYDYEKTRHNIPQPGILSLRKLAVSYSTYKNNEHTAYELGASVIGPVMSLYVSWICQRLEETGIKRIYPFMREGYVLGKLLQEESDAHGLGLVVKPVYISRKAAYIPSIKNINREEIENMIGARNLTVGESIKLMGLKTDRFSGYSSYFDVKYKEAHKIVCQDSTLKEKIIEKFLEEENKKDIEEYIKQERKKFVAYLLQETGDFNNIATADIGFFGRIQMWMQECLDLENIPHKIKHFLATGVTGDKVYDGIDFEGCFGTFVENMDLVQTIHRTTDVVEKLISVTEGSTTGYMEENGKLVPVLSEGVDNKHMTDIVFQGIFDFQKLWLWFQKHKPVTAQECIDKKRETLMLLHRLIDMPRKCEAVLLAGFEADTNFGTKYKKGIITEQHLELGRKMGVDFIDKCNASYTYKDSNITWPKGTVTMLDEFYYVRRALKNGSQNEIIKSMQETVEQAEKDGIGEVALYGAGENGRQFFFICQMYHIKVKCFIDRKESIWGTEKEGVEVVGLDEAISRGCDVYIVTSLFSISEITDYILEKYKGLGRKPVIYSV